jgi:hypothetical protein
MDRIVITQNAGCRSESPEEIDELLRYQVLHRGTKEFSQRKPFYIRNRTRKVFPGMSLQLFAEMWSKRLEVAGVRRKSRGNQRAGHIRPHHTTTAQRPCKSGQTALVLM